MEVIIVKDLLKRVALVVLDTMVIMLTIIGIRAYGYKCRYGIEYQVAVGIAVSDFYRPIDWILKGGD